MLEQSHHISSAIVVTRPEATDTLAESLATFEGVEVHATAPGKIVIVIEGPNTKMLGETLIQISGMDDVIAAHMVFEQELKKETTDDDRTDAA